MRMPGRAVDLVALLVESPRAFNEYRAAHPVEAFTLQGVNLEACDLAGADLHGANLFYLLVPPSSIVPTMPPRSSAAE